MVLSIEKALKKPAGIAKEAASPYSGGFTGGNKPATTVPTIYRAGGQAQSDIETGFYIGEEGRQQSEKDVQQAIGRYQQGRGQLQDLADRTRSGSVKAWQGQTADQVRDLDNLTNMYTQQATDLQNQAAQQAKDSRQVYSQTIQPGMKTALEDAEAYQQGIDQSAMSLGEYQDPSNRVASAYRDLYGQMGEQGAGMFQNDISGTRQRGRADAGVLQSLGMQAAESQMGQPMTAGQQAAIMAAQGRQAAEAYAGAQQRAQNLEDQARNYRLAMLGKGMEAGREESTKAYDRSRMAQESAMERTVNRIADIMRAEQTQAGLQSGLRGEQMGYQTGMTGQQRLTQDQIRSLEQTQQERADLAAEARLKQKFGTLGEDLRIAREMAQLGAAPSQRKEQMITEKALREIDIVAAQNNLETQLAAQEAQLTAAKESAEAQRQAALFGALGQVGGAVIGGLTTAGNPAGAATGAAAGGAAAGAISPTAPVVQAPVVQAPVAPTSFSRYPVTGYANQGYSPYGPYQYGYAYPTF